jgi:hypothetical protein
MKLSISFILSHAVTASDILIPYRQ